jgi:hypothetical protein
MMAVQDPQKTEQLLDERIQEFESSYPEIAEALKVFHLSSHDYLEALAKAQDTGDSLSGNGIVS